ncbi:uncharacterized protein RJT21DRAFT_17775 [Scheffersomyces amazonensis]|uniref:uncharacterized protein n=1 Tax=Scheffersomyces amazonensis TaxID=1078765 RepID=UPI00315C8FB8
MSVGRNSPAGSSHALDKNLRTPSPRSNVNHNQSHTQTQGTSSPSVSKHNNNNKVKTGGDLFNADEILTYLSKSYESHIQEAKKDKAGENIKIYKSLDASSPWKSSSSKPNNSNNLNINTTSTNSSTSNSNNSTGSGNSTHTNTSSNNNNNNNSNNVIRNHGSTLDILFEINRSIYQSQH